MPSLRLIVHSDYLCPWCWNAAHRLSRIEDAYEGRVDVEWRSFLLRPAPDARRDLERFRAYTRSWSRPAAEEDAAGPFREWRGDAGPPSHSVPPQLVAKAAAALGREAFRAMQDRLFRAYFSESRDVTDEATLRALWREAGLPGAEFERTADPALLRAVHEEHADAVERGIGGVPAARLEGDEAFILGAQPFAVYRRWLDRRLGALEGAAP